MALTIARIRPSKCTFRGLSPYFPFAWGLPEDALEWREYDIY